jgi:hypothetical protein
MTHRPSSGAWGSTYGSWDALPDPWRRRCPHSIGDVRALDDLVEAGVRSTRSDVAAWPIHVGIEVNARLFEAVHGTVTETRRLRGHAQALARQVTDAAPPTAVVSAVPSEPPLA